MLTSINQFVNNNYWTNTLGISRAVLALATLLTLLFNSKEILFYSGIKNENKPNLEELSMNLYTWFPDLEYGIYFSVFILFLVIIGIYPRITCVFHWLVCYSFLKTSMIGDGGDQIAAILSLLLIPICIVDRRVWHWSKSEKPANFYINTIAAIFHELIRLQMFVIYFFASVGKFPVTEWKNGTALYYWLKEPLFGPMDFYMPFIDVILQSPLLTSISTWFVLGFELFLALAYFFKNETLKKYTFISGVIFHFLIIVLFGLVSFFLVMASGLLISFVSKNKNYEFRNIHIRIPFINKLVLFFLSTKERKSILRVSNQKVFKES